MKRIILGALLASAVAVVPAMAALKQGEKAPDFKTKASLAGKEFNFSLADSLKKGPVVVYFYPAAYTGGCNIQAHTFAENADKFAASNATIIGVSLDSIQKLNKFSADPKYCAGKFPVASDADGAITKSYNLKVGDARAGAKDTEGEAIDHAFAERTTFVITQDSKIVATLSSNDDKLSPVEHVEKSLALVQDIAKKK